MKTDTSENGFNALMMRYMIDVDGFASGTTWVGSGKLDVREAADVLRLPDYPAYSELAQCLLPANRQGVLDALADDRLIRRDDAGNWEIMNLGAIPFAKQLDAFHGLRRKSISVVQYRRLGRAETLQENE